MAVAMPTVSPPALRVGPNLGLEFEPFLAWQNSLMPARKLEIKNRRFVPTLRAGAWFRGWCFRVRVEGAGNMPRGMSMCCF